MNYSRISKILKEAYPGRTVLNCQTSGLCSMRTGGRAAALVTTDTPEQMAGLVSVLEEEAVGYLILGDGTNTVFTADLPHLVLIRPGSTMGKITAGGGGSIRAGASAGTRALVRRAAAAGLDLAFLAGIPGTVGGAIAGNSGSRDEWICRDLDSLEYLKKTGTGVELARAGRQEIRSGYRRLDMPDMVAVVSAVLKPDTGDPAAIALKIRRNLARRKASQPLGARTSGCFFKNPGEGRRSAGALIEACRLKDFRYGGARVSPVHANFIENYKSASPDDIVVLSKIIRDRVHRESGIVLEYEVRLVGS